MEPAAHRARFMWRVKQRVTCQFFRQLPCWRPQETLVLLWKRMIPNWDSLVLKLVLLLAVLSVLAAVGSAALLSRAAPEKVHMVTRCTVPGSMQSYSSSTAFQAYRSESGTTYSALTLEDDPKYPCNIVTMPTVWVLQLLPMLMIQRSVSHEAVLRAIAYSGAVVVVLIVCTVLLSLRADTRYWLAIDDNGSGTTGSKSAIRRYVNLLSERGMITNFSTRTSVYDVHQMIEEHRHNVVDFSALALDCIIAQGATSVVMRGTLRRSTPVPIALKIYTDVQVTNEEVQRFSRETALNVQLSHPNVVHFYGLCVVPPSISLIFEFCEYGALDAILHEQPEIWTLAAKLKAWLDACRAVAYLHSFSPPLLHRDIKTDNFLVGQDFIIKLADFGEANLLQPRTDGTMTIAGTVDYMAPEMIKGGKTARYGTAVDVYSLMITLWQIMVPERSPWEARSHLEVYRRVTCGDRPPLLPTIPKACADILEAGWAANPNDRAAVEDIIPSVHRLWLLALHQKPLKRTKH
uniref:Protein kinase domain-containing protein n=1 Tax=Hyaloperonospora arabidopsidis (strain Emoy2) TaxID=559515 RepID=M4BMJ1_HYAAE